MAIIGASNSLGGLAGSNAIARLLVVMSGNTTQLESSLAQAEGSLAGFGRNATAIGKSLTRSVTLPLLAIGGLAIKTASDFETAFGKVLGLTTVLNPAFNDLELSANDLRQAIFDIASDPQVVAGPTDIAEALYFAGSAGLSASKALDVVKLSAQGASIGMGEAADISKVLIFALTNYEDTGLTAAAAMDSLTAAIQAGTAAPDELAIALGRLLPVAKAAGVTFQQVVASVAALTNLGVPTRVATTALRALFAQLLAPTQQAIDRLKLLGLTADDLRDALRAGPVAAFQLLIKATHGSQDALRDIIPQIRGFTAFLGLTDQQMRRYNQALTLVNNSQGTFKRALAIIAATPAFKFQKSLQALEIAGVKLGSSLLPVFVKLAGVLQDFAEIVSNLPDPVLAFLAALITLGAAAGPLLTLYGVITSVKTVTTALGVSTISLIPTWKALTSSFIAASVAAAIAFGSFQSLTDGTGGLLSAVIFLTSAFIAVNLGLKTLSGLAAAGALGTNQLSIALLGLGSRAGLVAASISLLALAFALTARASGEFRRDMSQATTTLYDAARSGENLKDALRGITDENIRQDLQDLAKQLNLLKIPTGAALPELGGGAGIALLGQLQALQQLSQGYGSAAQQIQPFITATQKAVDEGRFLGPMFKEAGVSADDLNTLLLQLNNTQVDTGSGFDEIVNNIQHYVGEYDGAIQALKDYRVSQAAQLTGFQLEEQALQHLADTYGTDTGFISSKLQELSLTATGVSGNIEDEFARAAFGVDENGNQIVGKVAEMRAALATHADAIREDLSGAFSPFGEVPKKFNKDIGKVIANYEKLRGVITQQVQDLAKLQAAGLPLKLIDQIQAEGPAAVHAFATASKSELEKLRIIYAAGMGAIDAEVLEEGKHQQEKGHTMVANFAKALLESSNLPVDASRQIINQMVQALVSGKIKPAALDLVQKFTEGLGTLKGISQQEGAKAVQLLANELVKGNILNKSGEIISQKVAKGIADALDIPVGKARELVERVNSTLSSSDQKAFSAGATYSREFGAGITAGQSAAISAAQAVANAVISIIQNAMFGSPRYFTYYLGQDLINQMGEGMKSRSINFRRPNILTASDQRFNSEIGRNGHTDIDLQVRLDRRRYARELDYEYSSRGK